MRAVIIAQIVLPGASEYERKSQRVDLESLREAHEVVTVDDPRALLSTGIRADVAHVYGPLTLPRAPFRDFRIPFISSGRMERRRLDFHRATEPKRVVAPVAGEGVELLPESVEDRYWNARERPSGAPRSRAIIGSLARPASRDWIELTMARLHRTRDDVDWLLFEHPPTPEELAGVDLWADPAIREDDYDGFVAEAMVAGVPVVGGRTSINLQRMNRGHSGTLVPPGDPNEMSHAILTLLFKPETTAVKLLAARQTLSKFRPRQRLKVLLPMYEALAA